MTATNPGRPSEEWLQRAGITKLPESASIFFEDRGGKASDLLIVQDTDPETSLTRTFEISATTTGSRTPDKIFAEVRVALAKLVPSEHGGPALAQ